jgi:hypothetical protein
MIPEVLVIKKVHISKSPILNGYGVMTAWNLKQKVRIIEKLWNKNIKQTHYLINLGHKQM